ncbi:MAG TPA: nucleotidyltransferase [Chitinophagaceae bacterium]|nr:nucleotidyltransferase [Chitinophagaceae bacterium]
MNLEPDFRDFVELLNQYEVDYMIVGGYALAFHGEPRFTGDMDIWINTSEENADKMLVVMKDFGAASLGFSKADFMDGGIIKQIGQPPLRIDILGEIDGVQYADAIKDKQQFKSGKLVIPYIGVKDFIRNKEATGRKKDLEDVKKLQKSKAIIITKKMKENTSLKKKGRR